MIRHELTLTSRKTREIETKLAKDLDRVAKLIEKNGLDISESHRRYDNLVYSIIKSAVQDIYLVGSKYVADYEELPMSLTPQDLSIIENQTREKFDAFWRSALRTVVRNAFEPDRPALNRAAMMSMLATNTATSTLAYATVQKTLEVEPEAVFEWETSLQENVCPICRPLHRMRWRANDPNLLHPIEDTHPNCNCRLLLVDGNTPYSH